MTGKVEINQLKQAVETQHGGKAILAQSVLVSESFEGNPVWEGIVHVFDLADHPNATRAYAWSATIEGSNKRRFFAILGIPPINSAQDAVRAAIVQEFREGKIK